MALQQQELGLILKVKVRYETIKAANNTGADLHDLICAYRIQQVLAW